MQTSQLTRFGHVRHGIQLYTSSRSHGKRFFSHEFSVSLSHSRTQTPCRVCLGTRRDPHPNPSRTRSAARLLLATVTYACVGVRLYFSTLRRCVHYRRIIGGVEFGWPARLIMGGGVFGWPTRQLVLHQLTQTMAVAATAGNRVKWLTDLDKFVIVSNFEKRGWVKASTEG